MEVLGLIEGGNPGVGTCKKRKDYCGIEEGLLYRGVEALSILSNLVVVVVVLVSAQHKQVGIFCCKDHDAHSEASTSCCSSTS